MKKINPCTAKFFRPAKVKIAGGYRAYFQQRRQFKKAMKMCAVIRDGRTKNGCTSNWNTKHMVWNEWRYTRPPFDTDETYDLGMMGDKHYKAFIAWAKEH